MASYTKRTFACVFEEYVVDVMRFPIVNVCILSIVIPRRFNDDIMNYYKSLKLNFWEDVAKKTVETTKKTNGSYGGKISANAASAAAANSNTVDINVIQKYWGAPQCEKYILQIESTQGTQPQPSQEMLQAPPRQQTVTQLFQEILYQTPQRPKLRRSLSDNSGYDIMKGTPVNMRYNLPRLNYLNESSDTCRQSTQSTQNTQSTQSTQNTQNTQSTQSTQNTKKRRNAARRRAPRQSPVITYNLIVKKHKDIKHICNGLASIIKKG